MLVLIFFFSFSFCFLFFESDFCFGDIPPSFPYDSCSTQLTRQPLTNSPSRSIMPTISILNVLCSIYPFPLSLLVFWFLFWNPYDLSRFGPFLCPLFTFHFSCNFIDLSTYLSCSYLEFLWLQQSRLFPLPLPPSRWMSRSLFVCFLHIVE